MEKTMICILCPVGCHLEVDTDLNVEGNRCPRGIEYAKKEMTNPTRTLTTTVAIKSATHRRLSVKSAHPLPKEKLFACMAIINNVLITAPVHIGDIIVPNILDTGVDIVATNTILNGDAASG